jgi:hypothetical protein
LTCPGSRGDNSEVTLEAAHQELHYLPSSKSSCPNKLVATTKNNMHLRIKY